MPSMNMETAVPYQPSLRDMVLLKLPLEVKLSPNGSKVAIRVRSTNWNKNEYEHHCHVHDLATGATRQINRTGNVNQMAWLDDETLALLKKEHDDEEAQIWIYEGLVGEGWLATSHKSKIDWFESFAGGLLYLARNPQREENEERAGQFGKYTHFEQEESSKALYYVSLPKLREYQKQAKLRTEKEAEELILPVIELSQLLDEPLSIRSVYPSADGDALYLNCWTRDDLVYFRETSTFRISLDAQSAVSEHIQREMEKLKNGTSAEDKNEKTEDPSYLGVITRLNLPRAASVTAVSPDARQLLIAYQERDSKMYTRVDLWTIDVDKAVSATNSEEFRAGMDNISASLDREVLELYWAESGIFGSYVEGTHISLARFAEDGRVSAVDLDGLFVDEGFHITGSGDIALVGANSTTFPEVFLAERPGEGAAWQTKQLTDYGRAVANWDLGTVETIRWQSKDGTEIEGVLRKPSGFDPDRKYPLVFDVHGGPRWFSEEYLITWDEIAYYPAVQFVNKDVLVLKPNYRGSLGRGQAFTDLNVNNLGSGDLWDLESAIEHLSGLGLVDEERIGCMGWSQGGYISAFAGLHSDRFAAVSVGAGVSDWYTYHISNDIPDFTVDYLSGSPFRERTLYEQTAPISNIANARTPMLIQHGSEDRRVPLSNAMELYRGLKEMGVPVELFIFPGMGHPITKPRENHAVMFQNLAWFSHFLLGEDLELE